MKKSELRNLIRECIAEALQNHSSILEAGRAGTNGKTLISPSTIKPGQYKNMSAYGVTVWGARNRSGVYKKFQYGANREQKAKEWSQTTEGTPTKRQQKTKTHSWQGIPVKSDHVPVQYD